MQLLFKCGGIARVYLPLKLEPKRSDAESSAFSFVSKCYEKDKTVLSDHSSASTLKEGFECTDEAGTIDVIGSLRHSSTLTDLSAIAGTCDEVELVSLLSEQIPRYKLRADTLTGFSGYENNDWFIETPVIDLQEPIDLSPEIIKETLKYFILSADRLSQMTKTYNDIEAVTKLLEEKERDLELAARIGQSLLEQNKDLKVRNEELENELAVANESVTQLKHDISVKNGLLQIYSADLEKSETESDTPVVSPQRDKSSLLLNWDLMHQRICVLEAENVVLRGEADSRKEDIELEEKKELQLIHDCAKQLTDANLQLITLQEELTRRTDDNIQQQEEITNLLTQVVELQRKIKEFSQENESLKNALLVSHECQNELSVELLDLKEKYGTLLAAFHELQEELRNRSRSTVSQWPPCAYMPVAESLAAELESEGYESELSSLTKLQRRDPDDTRCYSPDSVLSAGSVPRSNRVVFIPAMTSSINRQFNIPSKLKIVKPMEGSETLSKWRKLATPHLGVILEQQSGVQGKAYKSFVTSKTIGEMKLNNFTTKEQIDLPPFTGFRYFGNTSSVYTFTTTCLSQSTETTIVTPSFSCVQLSTGHNQPLSSVATSVTYSNFTQSVAATATTFSPMLPTKDEAMANTPISSHVHTTREKSVVPLTFGKLLPQLFKNKCQDYLSYLSGSSTTENNEIMKTNGCQSIHNISAGSASVIEMSNESGVQSNNVNVGLAGMQFFTPSGIITKGVVSSQLTKIGSPSVSLNVDRPSTLALKSDHIFCGKVTSLKTLRKGGFV